MPVKHSAHCTNQQSDAPASVDRTFQVKSCVCPETTASGAAGRDERLAQISADLLRGKNWIPDGRPHQRPRGQSRGQVEPDKVEGRDQRSHAFKPESVIICFYCECHPIALGTAHFADLYRPGLILIRRAGIFLFVLWVGGGHTCLTQFVYSDRL